MPSFGERLEGFRAYLRLLARLHLDRRLQGRVGESDVVQETFLRAVAHQDQFRGQSDGELAAWLRRIMANYLADLAEFHRAQVRDVQRERPLDAALHESSVRLMNFLADDSLSPQEKVIKEEETLRLTLALEELPAEPRAVFEARLLLGLPWKEVCARLGLEHNRAVGLLDRAMREIRKRLKREGESP